MKSFNHFGISASKRVYEQEVTYDAFSHVKVRDTIYWDIDTNDFSASYTNGRKTGVNAPDYDAAGNIVYTETGHTGKQWTTVDAAGRRTAVRDRWRVATAAHEENETGYVFDGDGRPVIEKEGMRSIIGLNPDPMVIHTEGYQVWSTVLGASLTTVNTVGNKRHTKVFAGGAHIATQDANGTTSTGDDRILFTTADPVTGTKATFNYTDGVSYFVREDTEPLGGQQIERNDPGTGYPTDYGQVLGTPRDPEWQCMLPKEFYGGFGGMPVHCQKAKLESKDFSIVEAFGFSVRESNPKKVSATDSPLPTIPGTGSDSPSALVLARSARATYKPSVERIRNDPHDGGDLGTVQSEPWTDRIDDISAEHAGTFSSDYASESCSKKVIEFLTNYAKGELGTLAPNAADYILPLLEYMQNNSASVAEVTFSLANSYHETQNFNKFIEDPSARSKNYDGGDEYRGRGYVHLTGKGTYKDLYNFMLKNYEPGFAPVIGTSTFGNPELAGEIQNALKIQTGYFAWRGTFKHLTNGDYLKARQTINPKESLDKRVWKGGPKIRERITGLTSGLEPIIASGDCQ